ncbi:hypothetical protein HG535_0A06080 [Zygotorulaspora mrakii]|uniref:TRUD domain-containing protein n=1 Tax=Zygotorulaspora mrakii TaxID=42260 RepID=A0A7H9AWJ2_ZYGMR|nr:uncharacterized protein HG535_0A06080 [Zygotorulaspora mrakii]QLG70666.1 hypothetical protein HG535_0A06080 [Zygotorulaspora mrakii]
MSDSNTAIKRNLDEEACLETDSKRPKNDEVAIIEDDGIHEEDVGITHFLSSEIPGFSGQIKQRFTDFLVNEIDNEGNVVHLTDKGFKMPKKQKPSKEEKTAKNDDEEKRRQDFKIDAEMKKELLGLLSEADLEKIENVYYNAQRMETSKSIEEKSERAKLHQLLRTAFNNELESVTTERNTFKIARRGKNSRVSREDWVEQNKDANGVENWGYGPTKDFLHFTLYKENKDTMDAVNTLTKFLRMPSRVIRFAGTKDRRAVTCQRLCVSRVGVDRINALNRTLRGIVMGGFKFEDKSLNLGDLKGNEFVIVIRDVKLNANTQESLKSILEKGTASLAKNGFVNYFGMQRFGTFSISTHTVGKELLLENWEKACELILSDQVNVLPKSKEGRKVWAKTKDPALALKSMPRQCVAENAILHSLSAQRKGENGYSSNAYYAAVMKIPRNLRTMYVHAYQSFVWNYVTSKRIELFGMKLMEGDLVIIENDTVDNKNEEVGEEDDFDEDLRDAKFVRARPLTKEDIDSGKYSVDDVVLPTPGFDVIYPSNEIIKQIYIDIMAKDGMDPFNMKRKVREFSLAGSYRNILQKPQGLEYKITKYTSPTQQLVNTDFEILNNKVAKENCQKFFKDKLERYVPDKGGENTAVILKFQLGVSSYATMALRELMKLETSRRGDMCDVRVQNIQINDKVPLKDE